MTRSVVVLLILLMSGGLAAAQDSTYVPEILQWYYDHYPFVTQTDSTFTFESEFVWPDGFHRPDSSEQTAFQNWVSHFPLWHRWRPVGNWKGRKQYERDETCARHGLCPRLAHDLHGDGTQEERRHHQRE